MKKRNCRKTDVEKDIRERAVRLGKMSDVQILEYIAGLEGQIERNEMDAKMLPERVRAARGDLSLREFAKKCGISHTHLDSIEKGVDSRTGKPVSVSVDTLVKLASGIGCTAHELIELSIQKNEALWRKNISDSLIRLESCYFSEYCILKYLRMTEKYLDRKYLILDTRSRIADVIGNLTAMDRLIQEQFSKEVSEL